LAGGRFLFDSAYAKSIFFSHIEFHSESFQNLFNKFIRILQKLSKIPMMKHRCFDLLDRAESKLYEVTQGNIKRSSETAQSLVFKQKTVEEIPVKKD
jgi:replicative DNA helicase